MNNTKGPWIVLVDDDPDIHMVMDWFIKKFFPQFRLLCLGSSRNFAQELAKLDSPPVLFIFDYYMSGPFDGRSLFLLVKGMKGHENIPIVGISAAIRQVEVEDLQKLGFVIAASKPFNTESLREHLDAILNQSKRTWAFIPSPRYG
jgi:response regulator of citrate/malate metabolism